MHFVTFEIHRHLCSGLGPSSPLPSPPPPPPPPPPTPPRLHTTQNYLPVSLHFQDPESHFVWDEDAAHISWKHTHTLH